MSFIKLTSHGSWFIRSDSDPRWNDDGSGNVGGAFMPPACRASIERNKERYGEQPEDLEWGYMKY